MPNYPRPPITEAVIELQFGDQISVEVVEKVKARLAADYSVIEPANVPLVKMELPAGPPTVSMITGHKLSSADRTDVALVSQLRMAWSRLPPYHDWSELYDRVSRDWASFKRLAGYCRINRIGVRYLNRLDIPHEGRGTIKIEDYLKVYAESPESAAIEAMHGFVTQVTGSVRGGYNLTINAAIVPSALLNHISVLLDIDIGRAANVPQKDDEIFLLSLKCGNLRMKYLKQA